MQRGFSYLTPAIVLVISLTGACNSPSTKSGGQKSGGSQNVNVQTKFDGQTQTGNQTTTIIGGQGTPQGSQTGQTGANCYKGMPSICAIETQIFQLVNGERTHPRPHGLGTPSPRQALVYDMKTAFVAREWSGVQGDRDNIGHDGFPDMRMQAYQKEFGSQPDIEGENVAMTGDGSDPSGDASMSQQQIEEVAKEFFDMWWGSEGHYENMMGDYATIGVGVYHNGNGWFATQIFGQQ